MNKIFIVDIHKNPNLLKFTETKVFFNAKNVGVWWAEDCTVVDSIDQITADKGIVINSGEFVSTAFRTKYPEATTLVDARGDETLIQFTADYDYTMNRRPPYAEGSKQLYILENLYKISLKAKKLVYLDNTEPYTASDCKPDHFYGLASGWKSVQYVRDFGIENLKTITIYDVNTRQLEYQQYLHRCPELPSTVEVSSPVCGEYNPPDDIKEFWPKWHTAKVEFKLIDLFNPPEFPDNSFIWISNVFRYEPTIFRYGWERCKTAKQDLFLKNKSSTIVIV